MMRHQVLPLFAVLEMIGRLAGAQNPDIIHRDPGAVISGVVRDSISRRPLPDATVQLVAADSLPTFGRMAVSDSSGRYTIADVPDGRYLLGFFHPMLDSLGVEAPLQSIEVVEQRSVRADLEGPTPQQLRAAFCGRRAADAGSVVVGVVRDARDGTPVPGATVLAEWVEITYKTRQAVPTIPGVAVTSGVQGWFTLCGLPKAGIVGLTVSRGADSTGLVELDVPPERILRRDFYVGAARVADLADSSRRDAAAPPPTRPTRIGNGRLSGTVVRIVGGKPISGAEVGIADGPTTHSNERGQWTLNELPTGTRTLDVRAVGYYPIRRPVDVVADAQPVHVAMFTLRAMLDTVKVSAARNSHRMITGFDDRRRSGAGTYLTPADVAKHAPIVASDLFHYGFVHGVRIERVGSHDNRFLMHGAFSAECSPEVYINDHYMDHIGPDELDSWVRPNEIVGIEIYSESSVPPQFHRSMGDCGAIVVWSKGW